MLSQIWKSLSMDNLQILPAEPILVCICVTIIENLLLHFVKSHHPIAKVILRENRANFINCKACYFILRGDFRKLILGLPCYAKSNVYSSLVITSLSLIVNLTYHR